MRPLLAALVLLADPVAVAPAAEAQTDRCPGAVTQLDLTDCAAREYRDADADLNRVYRDVMSLAGARQERGLREAQRAWLRFRDAHCAVEAAAYEGGSIQPMVRAFCLAGVTEQRADQLREMLGRLRDR